MAIGRKNSESMIIGMYIDQMMMFAERNDRAMLPTALPMAKKVTMPSTVTPPNATQDPRTWTFKKTLPTANRMRIPTTTKAN